MIQIAKRLSGVKPSQTKAIAQKAAERKAQGYDVISLNVGEPDFDTSENIINAGISAMKEGHTRYTLVPGVLPLREVISTSLENDHGIRYTPEEITVCTGAKQVLYNALLATIDQGDEVILIAPCWPSYPDMVSLAGGVPVIVNSSRRNDFLPDLKDIESKISGKTKWILMNYPNNPTGAILNDDYLEQFADILSRNPHVSILSDDVYEKIVYPGEQFKHLLTIAPKLKDRCLMVNSVSKAYCMTGWRIGYGAGPAELIKTMNMIQSQTTSHATSISQYAAIEALSGPQTSLKEMVAHYYKRAKFAHEKLNSINGIKCLMPKGTFYLLPDCSEISGMRKPDGNLIKNDIDFSAYLMEEAGVAVVPGSSFFAENSFRVSSATSMENLASALDKIAEAVNKLK